MTRVRQAMFLAACAALLLFAPHASAQIQPAKPPRSLGDLLDPPLKPGEFPLPPEVDVAKAKAAGLRKIEGKQVTLWTDVPAAPEVDELAAVFDQAVPQWAAYFKINPPQTTRWKLVGYIVQDKEKFQRAELFPDTLPPFLNGFQRGAEFWLYDQPGEYYRRHLMLHEGTHAFMSHFLGGGGPPWYSEGMAELLATHQWKDDKLTLNVMPATRDEVPYWGRVKIIKDAFAAGRGLLLTDVMKYDNQAHLKNEPYGWSWGAAYFCDRHPLTSAAFRELQKNVQERSIDFSKNFYDALGADQAAVNEDWMLFVNDIDYGYDVARSAVVRKAAGPMPAKGAQAIVAADRGWQSTGFQVVAGKKYQLAAKGKFQIGSQPKPLPCEADGVTIHYYNGRPLGMLTAAIGDVAKPSGISSLVNTIAVGKRGDLTPAADGVLYLRINEASSDLHDNAGSLTVDLRPAP